ncbi:pseudaminic acid cytidylyltransferase [Shewanella psychropiezotolerans]|uniref:Pseudaminic acid cytidylyltransferase n=1 Tax=Shewanella psychropiezotolerans TaxID=2593655 RepID=A0ABX5WX96_9GAMM|nr:MULTISPECIES: pseudaminic acid cytidylyltransferase [Shewanella]MPY24952.1 pseudaminic acid cytidylyltransferase [Shewanella sp. YLB-07]QDO83416.1 pseudaminic acid cytidylyltransferase [Shewanella psychropiezotolerans]
MNVAIIPARGGSKRIPQKNIKDFCGKPMLSYAIETALISGCFDEVVVSTDCPVTATLAEKCGAVVPFMRPASLSDDHTGTTDVIRHAIKQLRLLDYDVELVCCLYATTPLLQGKTLKRGLKLLTSDDSVDFVFSACHFSFPIQRALIENEFGGIEPFDPKSIGQRSQDLTPTYHDAGQFYWGRAEAFLDPTRSVFGSNGRMLLLPTHRVQDIDTIEDWYRAEILYQLLKVEESKGNHHNETA